MIGIKVQDEAANANVEAAASYPEDLAQITHPSGYTEQQIFNVGKTAICWEMLPSTFILERRSQCLTLKLQRTGDNAAGDLKLK